MASTLSAGGYRRLRSGLAPLAASAAAAAFGACFVSLEHPAYPWDWGRYYRYYKLFGSIGDPGSLVVALVQSIASWDYNASSIAPLLPVFAVWGASRAAYVAAILALYTVPACLLAARLAAPAHGSGSGRAPSAAIVAGALFFWPLWASGLRGMPDVVGLIPLGLATILLRRTAFLSTAGPRQGLLLGLLLWTAFLLRRWYAYSAVAVGVVAFCFCAAVVLRLPAEERRARARAAAMAFVIAAITAGCCVAALQAPLLFRILHTNYGEIYAAYQAPFSTQLHHLLARVGPLIAVAAALGIVRGALERDTAVLFPAALAVATFLLFSRTQECGDQHVLPIFFWLFPAIVAGATWPAAKLEGRAAAAACATLPLVMALGFATVFVPGVRDRLIAIAPVLPSTTFPPLRLAHYATYEALTGELGRLTRSGERFAVFASSEKLSDSLLTALDPSLESARVPASQVDLRDGLSLEPFTARYAVTTATPALHLPPETQRVISVPNAAIRGGAGYAAAYRRLSGPYLLDDGIEATIMERVRPLSDADRAEIVAGMREAYPAWRPRPDGALR